MGIGVYALSTPSAFHAAVAPAAFLPDAEDAPALTVVQSSAFQPSFPVMETPSFHLSGHLSGPTPNTGESSESSADESSSEESQTATTEKEADMHQQEGMLTLAGYPASPVIHYPAPASPALELPAPSVTAINGGDAPEVDPLPAIMPNGKALSDMDAVKETVLAYAPPTRKPQKPLNRIVKVGKGDTLSSILIDAGVPTFEAQDAISAIKAVYNPRRLQAGQQVTLTFGPKSNGKSNGGHKVDGNGANGNDRHKPIFQSLNLSASVDRKVGVNRGEDGIFSSHEVKRELKKKMVRAGGAIHTSLAQATTAQGIPRNVLAEMVGAFSYDVDFQRDIQNNDAFEVMFEGLYDNKDQFVRNGKIMFATLTLSGVRMPVYRYKNSNGMTEFYNEKGQSVQKALLRTPVDGARLSSRYGKRRHPILGYTRMHRGADFAANKGTPIKAAGNGVIGQAGRNGAYGHYIKIRHNSEYSTAYAHLSRYKKGVHAGKRVKQGEIIGYVGSTGRSTGPHLHFEVIRHGKRINPLSVKLPSGTKLAGKELKKFLALVNDIKRQYAQLPVTTKLASRQ